MEERFKKKGKWRGEKVRREEAEKEAGVRKERKWQRMDKEKSQEHSNDGAG